MSATEVAVLATGLVTSVGLSGPQTCAALRAKVANPTPTRFIGGDGAWLMAHQVQLAQPWGGLRKLAKMGAMAIAEALDGVPAPQWAEVPLLLCVAEPQRPGRPSGLDEQLLPMIQEALGVQFAPGSAIVAGGRVGIATAMALTAREIARRRGRKVLVAAVDGLVSWPTMKHFESQGRLLAQDNADGFVPGEGAGALLLGAADGSAGELVCAGIGFGTEAATIDSGQPLRADGLVLAVQSALQAAGLSMRDIDFRITDNSGEQFYFKEAALTVSRTLRTRRPVLDLWNPGECVGETGALAGAVIVALAKAALEKRFAKGDNILAHMGTDEGARAALVLRQRRAA